MSSVSYNVKRNIHPAYGRLLLAVSTIDPKEIGKRIAAARGRKGWTQLTFAAEANVSPSSIQRWEAGRLPPVRELIRLAGLLEIDPEQLVEIADGPTNLEAVLERVEEVQAEVREVRGLVESLLAGQRPAPTGKRRTRSAG
jgi:transcriptional regulator with XRE-family HTH domain